MTTVQWGTTSSGILNKNERKKTRQLLLVAQLLSEKKAWDEETLWKKLPPYGDIYRASLDKEANEKKAKDALRKRLKQDVEDLERIGIKIEIEVAKDWLHEGGQERRVYRLPLRNFSPVDLDLTDDERAVLVSAARAMSQGFPYAAPLRLALANLIGAVSFDPAAADDKIALAAALSSSDDAAISNRVGRLDDAISRRRRIRFDYRPVPGGEISTFQIEPYLLARLGDTWYVTGRDTSDGAILQINVSRIVGKIAFAANKDGADFKRPRNLARLYPAPPAPWQLGESKDTARIRILSAEARNRLEQSYRWSGDFGREEDYRTFITRYSDERPLVRWVLSLGKGATVTSPDSLAEQVAVGLEKLAAAHAEAGV